MLNIIKFHKYINFILVRKQLAKEDACVELALIRDEIAALIYLLGNSYSTDNLILGI